MSLAVLFLAYNGLRSSYLSLLSLNSSSIADRTKHSVSISSNVGGRQPLAIEKKKQQHQLRTNF